MNFYKKNNLLNKNHGLTEKILDLFPIERDGDKFNYYFFLEICEYLFDDIISFNGFIVRFFGIKQRIYFLNKDIRNFHLQLFGKNGMHLDDSLILGTKIKNNCSIYTNFFRWNIDKKNYKVIKDKERNILRNLGLNSITSDIGWSKGRHVHFLEVSGNSNCLYLGFVDKNKSDLDGQIHKIENLLIGRLRNWNTKEKIILKIDMNCCLGVAEIKNMDSMENNYININFPANTKIHIGAFFGNWGINLKVNKSIYFI